MDSPLVQQIKQLESDAAELAALKTKPVPPPAAVTPAGLLNIGPALGQNHFSFQMAPDGAKEIRTVSQDELAAGFSDPTHLSVVGDWVQVSPRADGPTTSGTKYARDEFREVNPDGSKMRFDPLAGEHGIEVEIRILHVPAEDPDVVVLQLHNGDADRIAIRTQQYSNGNVVLGCRFNGSLHTVFVDGWKASTESHKLRIELNYGQQFIYFDGTLEASGRFLQPSSHPDGWYWKTGAYNQFHPTLVGATGMKPKPSDGSVVQLRNLRTWHRG